MDFDLQIYLLRLLLNKLYICIIITNSSLNLSRLARTMSDSPRRSPIPEGPVGNATPEHEKEEEEALLHLRLGLVVVFLTTPLLILLQLKLISCVVSLQHPTSSFRAARKLTERCSTGRVLQANVIVPTHALGFAWLPRKDDGMIGAGGGLNLNLMPNLIQGPILAILSFSFRVMQGEIHPQRHHSQLVELMKL